MIPQREKCYISDLEPLCKIIQADVLSSIFSHSSEMNLGWTLKDLMVTRPARVSEK